MKFAAPSPSASSAKKKKTMHVASSPLSPPASSSIPADVSPIEATPISRHPPTPTVIPTVAGSSGSVTAHFPEGFGNDDFVKYFPALDQIMFPPYVEEFKRYSPEDMGDIAAVNCLAALQSALYNRRTINRVQTASLATSSKNRELADKATTMEQQCRELKDRVVELKADLAEAKAQKKESVDGLARTQKVWSNFDEALKTADARIEELTNLATDIAAYATWKGKVNGMRAALEGPLTLADVEEEERQLGELYPTPPDVSILFPEAGEVNSPHTVVDAAAEEAGASQAAAVKKTAAADSDAGVPVQPNPIPVKESQVEAREEQ
ncbi:hypothetical protein RND81_10G002900 [Saponaria officinalis]|uniref:Uncharacterized protein n=1 Tax=Saponaria officinalis TaxID=3572 RepID=A0AAW1HWZ8_SAPOF